MELLSAKAQFAVEFIDLPTAAAVADARWEQFQIGFLNNQNRFGIDCKARQIAWSFTAAVDAVVDAILVPDTPHIFVSINKDEAAEKIRYAHAILDAMDPPVRPALVRDTVYALEFDNGSRLISHPCRPPRGKPNARIYLDEMAHYLPGMDRQIYRGALPATVRGNGYVRVGSSPLGASGMFWEIFTESLRPYPGYRENRRYVPWWVVRSMCSDTATAYAQAPTMVSEDRVRAFGTPALVELFENMFLEDFQQEHECAWLDETTAWISWDVIKRNQRADLLYYTATNVDEALNLIEVVNAGIADGHIEPALTGGLDIGRRHDLTEFVVLGKTTTGQMPLRMMVSLHNVEYDDQEACFRELIRRLPFTMVLIDRNGIGAQLAENLERDTNRVARGVDFTNPAKEIWAVEARIQAERGNTPLPIKRDLSYQIHSVKKYATPTKLNRFDVERNEKHHADKFWAWALAIYAASGKTGAWGF